MAKKYLSLEEAAQLAGLSIDDLMRMREAGDIRGFADRGTWKFKSDDVEELKRSRQFDSNPEVPLMDVDDSTDSEDRGGAADHSVLAGDDSVGEMPTVIRQSVLDDDEEDTLPTHRSDSDVRLYFDDSLGTDDAADEDDLLVTADDSDSDVKLVDSSPALQKRSSDSEVNLMGSDSDVRLVQPESDSDVQLLDAGSDSDVRLMPEERTDSDIPLLDVDDSDSDVTLVPDDGTGAPAAAKSTPVKPPERPAPGSVFEFDEEGSGLALGQGSSIKLSSESGISLESLDSDITRKAADSDIDDSDMSLGGPDSSGLTLDDGDDSGLSLEIDDSGIALEGFDDSGLSLGGEDDLVTFDTGSGVSGPADSGIALESIDDSGIGLDSADDGIGGTIPMLDVSDVGLDKDDTAMEIPAVEGESAYELASQSSDNVLSFDDDEDYSDHDPTVVRSSAAVEEPASQEFDLTEDDGFDEFGSDHEFGGADEFADDEEFEPAAATDTDYDEDGDLDAFEEDEDFGSEFDEGESQADFEPTTVRGGQVAAPVQAEWGTGPFIGLLLSTLLLVVCGLMMFDLVRSMWSWQDPSGFNSPLLGFVKDMLK